jgi:hypothetical protein
VVATDDRRIAEAAARCGVEAVMTAYGHPSGTDRTAEAARKYPADIIVNIQGDEPTIDPELINRLIGVMLTEKKWDMATAAGGRAARPPAPPPGGRAPPRPPRRPPHAPPPGRRRVGVRRAVVPGIRIGGA